MKRENIRYSSIVGGDIYNHYGIFFWKECFFCDKEFRREAGYRFQVQWGNPWVYSCAGCSSSKQDVDDNMKKFKSNRPKAPPAPPRSR